MPQFLTATTTSSGPGVGRAIPSTTRSCGPRQRTPRIVAVTSPPRVMLLDRGARLRREGVAILEAQPGGRDGPFDHDLDLAGDHRAPPAPRHEPSRAAAHDRHDGQSEPDGKDEPALLEVAQPPVATPPAFREDDERLPLVAH